MPVYEYHCDTCGKTFEVIQKFNDEPLTVHEGDCGGPVHRLLSAPAFQFKGSGWYVTDYAKGNSNASSTPPAKETPKADTPAKPSPSTDSTDTK
jgi:putative FmdB family regulatory protein